MTAPRQILVVEDEPLIAMMLEDLLETLGHQVVGTADSVADALARVSAGGFDLAILDVNLRDGEASWPVADALADGGTRFILATGGGAAAPPRHDGARTLAKPYTLADLERALDD